MEGDIAAVNNAFMLHMSVLFENMCRDLAKSDVAIARKHFTEGYRCAKIARAEMVQHMQDLA